MSQSRPDENESHDGSIEPMPEDSERIVAALKEVTEELKSQKSKQQPSWLAVAGIVITLLLYAVMSGRWSGTSDKTVESQKELTDLKIKFTEDKLDQYRKDIERFESEKNAQIKQLIDDLSLLKTRADSTDRRLSNGGIK